VRILSQQISVAHANHCHTRNWTLSKRDFISFFKNNPGGFFVKNKAAKWILKSSTYLKTRDSNIATEITNRNQSPFFSLWRKRSIYDVTINTGAYFFRVETGLLRLFDVLSVQLPLSTLPFLCQLLAQVGQATVFLPFEVVVQVAQFRGVFQHHLLLHHSSKLRGAFRF